MTKEEKAAVRKALDHAVDPGTTQRDEFRFANIEALLRDLLGQKHGVWSWRVKKAKEKRA